MCKETIILDINKDAIDVDRCIAPIVKALNDSGIKTVASCCGHGKIGNIALKDGRELFIISGYNKAREFERRY